MSEDVTFLARLIEGIARNVELSSNALVVNSLKVGSSTPAELTKDILTALIALQNGTDISYVANVSGHAHDARYFTESELGSAITLTSGSTLIGDDNSYTHFTPAAATIKGALSGIDTAIGGLLSTLTAGPGIDIDGTTISVADLGIVTSMIADTAVTMAKLNNDVIDLGLTRVTVPNTTVSLGTSLAGSTLRTVVHIGTDIYVGGSFSAINGVTANNIAKWNGTSWSALGSGTSGTVIAMLAIGTDLYVGGSFFTADGNTVNNIAKYDTLTSIWSVLDNGCNGSINSIVKLGTDIYVGGTFTAMGAVPANYIAKWNGTNWSALGSGFDSDVQALTTIGTDLYAGGWFTSSGAITLNYIAKWNGTSWSALIDNLAIGVNNAVYALTSIGTALYVGGLFSSVGDSIPASNIAKWNGTSWSALGSGLSAGPQTMVVSGTTLYVGGAFNTAGGVTVNKIAKNNTLLSGDAAWSAIGTGCDGTVYSIDSLISSIYAVGSFTTFDGVSAGAKIVQHTPSHLGGIGIKLDGATLTVSTDGVKINSNLLTMPVIGDVGKALVATGANTAAWTTVSTADEKIKISATDTTAGYLASKLLAGSAITLTTANDPGNATLSVSIADGAIIGDKLAASAVDNSTIELIAGLGTPALIISNTTYEFGQPVFEQFYEGTVTRGYVSQSFTLASPTSITELQFYLEKIGTTAFTAGSIRVSLYEGDVNDKPTGSVLGYAEVLATSLNGAAAFCSFAFSSPIAVTARKYCAVISKVNIPNPPSPNSVGIKAGASYTVDNISGGKQGESANGTSWSFPNGATADLMMKVYAAGAGALRLAVKNLGVTTAKIADNAVTASKVRLENNAALRARNAANDADVNILKVNTSNIIEFASFPITPTGTPDADYEVANKKYVDDGLSSLSGYNVYDYTVNNTDISNGYITLPAIPKTAASTIVMLKNAPTQVLTYDYTVVGNKIYFSMVYPDSLGNIIADGDRLIVIYN